VYDSAHLGHARAYVTFDIVRRIMTDYFGYNVVYVMNITDVDDKIILKARKNHLFAAYKAEKKPLDAVVADVRAAFAASLAKFDAKLETARADITTAAAKHVDAKKLLVTETEFKRKLVADDAGKLDAVMSGGGGDERLANVFSIGADVLADALDSEKGSEVKDQAMFRAHAARYEEEFLEDMEMLGVRDADSLTRVTEYVEQIIVFIQGIIDKGHAYAAGGSVYFDVAHFSETNDYAKLSPHCVGNSELVAEGEGALASASATSDKRNPTDFALWKASKAGEPVWDSPWGAGRPGWHIECSAMASDVLGDNFDVHSGGEDLRFPHHDNELAQSEACSGNKQWVNYFWHAGHLHIAGLKMSKSLKNFFTIREILEMNSPRQVRLLFLLQLWDAKMQYSDQGLEEATQKEKMLKEFFLNTASVIRMRSKTLISARPQVWNEADRALHTTLTATQTTAHQCLLDSFNYPGAMLAIFALVSATNKYLRTNEKTAKVLVVKRVVAYVDKMLRVFGVIPDSSPGFTTDSAGAGAAAADAEAKWIDAIAAFRDTVRTAAQQKASPAEFLAACDHLRDEVMIGNGVRLEDKGASSTWKRDDPVALRRERDEKRAAAAGQRLKKMASKVAAKRKDVERWEAASSTPREKFEAAGYKQFDEKGLPTHDPTTGEPLSKKMSKNVAKDATKQEKANVNYAAEVEKNAGFLDELREQMKTLAAELAAAEAETATADKN
jgi:cysteinyl-tRNA synthetase